jgi:hypothetical protein
MSKVFLHTRSQGQKDWINTSREFLRLPVVGEYLATSASSSWYKIELVVHCPFEAEYSAEIYAVEVNHMEEIDKLLS